MGTDGTDALQLVRFGVDDGEDVDFGHGCEGGPSELREGVKDAIDRLYGGWTNDELVDSEQGTEGDEIPKPRH